MENTELIITIICLALGLLARPWRFKENRNSNGKLSFVAVFGWALIIVGGLLLISAINKGVGLAVSYVFPWLVGLFLTVWLGYELLLFSRKYTIQQVFWGGVILTIAVALSLLGFNINEQMVLMCVIVLMACLGVLLLLRRFFK